MIAKITTRTDFSGIVNYANNVKEKSARIIGNNGVLLIDNSTIADSFQAQLRIPDANGKLHHLSKPSETCLNRVLPGRCRPFSRQRG